MGRAVYGRHRLDAEQVAHRVLDAGHDAPITHPALLAEALLDIAATTP